MLLVNRLGGADTVGDASSKVDQGVQLIGTTELLATHLPWLAPPSPVLVELRKVDDTLYEVDY